MVKYSAGSLDALFAALTDPTRRAILFRLTQGEATVTELAAPFAMSLPAISKHLRVLARSGLIVRQKDGRLRRCRLEPGPLHAVAAWLAAFDPRWTRP